MLDRDVLHVPCNGGKWDAIINYEGGVCVELILLGSFTLCIDRNQEDHQLKSILMKLYI